MIGSILFGILFFLAIPRVIGLGMKKLLCRWQRPFWRLVTAHLLALPAYLLFLMALTLLMAPGAYFGAAFMAMAVGIAPWGIWFLADLLTFAYRSQRHKRMPVETSGNA